MKFTQLSKQFTAARAVHVTMIIFALASVTNIKAFFISAGHDNFAAWAIGGALGLVLVSASIMLSKVDFDSERRTFWLVASITAFIAILSGTIQTLAYAQHITSRFTAGLLGYGLPIGGEMLLAIAVSMFDLAHKRQRIRNVGTDTEEQIAHAIGEALADVDVSKVRKYAERQVDLIVRSQVDRITAQYIGLQQPQTGANDVQVGNRGERPEQPVSNQMTGFGRANLPAANEARQRKIAERRDRIAGLITDNGGLTTGEITKLLAGDAKEKTVRSDCNTLAQEGRIYKGEGYKWMPVLPGALPTIFTPLSTEISHNGAH